jgi:hypothetical protein
MEGWQIPKSDTYHLTAKNLVGLTVINVRYQVLRTYGGSYKGKGKYLTAVGVQPLLVDVAWGYHFSMDAFIPDESIVNVGRADDPIAALTAQVKWRISTPVQDTQGQGFYFLQGDGLLREIGKPFSKSGSYLLGLSREGRKN